MPGPGIYSQSGVRVISVTTYRIQDGSVTVLDGHLDAECVPEFSFCIGG